MTQQADPPATVESTGLDEFGYSQQLDRVLGKGAMFALAFAFMSVLSGIAALFGSGWYFAGPSMWWGWVIVVGGQLVVALMFAELSAQWPVAGSVYNWAKKLATPAVSWMSGWFISLTILLTVGSVTSALAIVLPQISPVFQLVGDGTGPYDYVENVVLLGSICLVLVTVLNLSSVKIIGRFNNLAVGIELAACFFLVLGFLLNAKRSPAVVLQTNGTDVGHPGGWLAALIPAMLIGLWTMYGFDTASGMAEESKNPRRDAPRAIVRAVLASGGLGAAVILVTAMAVPKLGDPNVAVGGLPYVIRQTFGTVLGDVFLAAIVVALFSCVAAAQTYGARMIFAMARDERLPFSRQLSRVGRSKEPIVPIVLICVTNILVLVLNLRQTQIVAVLASVGTAFIYSAYVMVTLPLLVRRIKGEWPLRNDLGRTEFSLGRWGLPLNVVAVLWGIAMVVNLVWPRAEIYNATAPFHWYLQWGGVLAFVIATGVGAVYYATVQRRKRPAAATVTVTVSPTLDAPRLDGVDA